MVAGIAYVFMGFVIGHVQLSLLIMRARWDIDNNRPFISLSGFAKNWLKCVHMCEIISQPDHLFKSYDQIIKCYMPALYACAICLCLSLDEA